MKKKSKTVQQSADSLKAKGVSPKWADRMAVAIHTYHDTTIPIAEKEQAAKYLYDAIRQFKRTVKVRQVTLDKIRKNLKTRNKEQA